MDASVSDCQTRQIEPALPEFGSPRLGHQVRPVSPATIRQPVGAASVIVGVTCPLAGARFVEGRRQSQTHGGRFDDIN